MHLHYNHPMLLPHSLSLCQFCPRQHQQAAAYFKLLHALVFFFFFFCSSIVASSSTWIMLSLTRWMRTLNERSWVLFIFFFIFYYYLHFFNFFGGVSGSSCCFACTARESLLIASFPRKLWATSPGKCSLRPLVCRERPKTVFEVARRCIHLYGC